MLLSGFHISLLSACRSSMRLLFAAAMLSCLTGCGYHLAGSAENRLATGQTLWVSFIGNETTSPSAQTVIRRALLEEGHAMRGLSPAGSESGADLLVNGFLRSYSSDAISYNAIDQAREYRLTIDVELELHRKGTAAPLWKGTLRSSKDYPANILNNALQRSAEEAALVSASHILAQKFLTAVEQSY
jgi:outer membrane lipopolysaccharide assembly protein LptE/RlpB